MKRYFIVLLSVLLLLALALPVFAEQISGVNIPDADPSTKAHEITLKQAFDTGKLGNRTVTVDGKSQKDVLLVGRAGDNTCYLVSLGDGYKKSDSKTFDEFVKGYLITEARYYVMSYPGTEVVSINGVAWQNSEWGDFLKERIEMFLDFLPNEKLSKNLKDWDIAQKPVYNGLGKDIKDGKLTLAQAQKKGEELQGETAPIVTPVGENITLTMTLNNPKYTVATKTGTETKTLDVAPFAKSGVTLVPVRGVFEAFDAYVEWLPDKQEVKVTKGDDLIILRINSKTATVNGKSAKLLQPAQIIKGRTLIPLRFISENIGYDVQYISKTKQIIITD